MKKIISLMLVLLLVVGCFAGCGSNGNAKGEGSKIIGVCMQNKSSSISVLQEEALIEMFEPLGYDVQVVSADDSSATQRSQVENFILLNAEMLVILPCEISTLEDSLIKAREQGIKVVVSGGTGTVSEDAYDAVCSDDEFMVGMYVASVAKTWIEGNMDPNGDWEVHFLSSTLSEDAITRCQGEAMILEQYLKNKNGEYVNLMGEVVDEANKVENPVYCEMVASRVSSYEECSTQMSMSDNRGVVSGVLTEHPNVRVFIAYNSLASTAGSTYITDTYANANEYAFFSGGVMGDEYEYLIGSVAEGAGTYSCFRGACQFGGGDAAATLADLCNRVMFGEAGVDYGKTNPNTIGLYYPIDGEINGGTDALVCFDAPPYISAYTYEEILAQEKLMTYWDSANGYNKNMQEAPVVDVPVVDKALEHGYAVVAVDYRKSSEAVFPAALSDVKAAVRWVRAHAMEYGFDPEHIAAWGESAGAYLASMTALTPDVAALNGDMTEFDKIPNGVTALVSFYAPIEFYTMYDEAGKPESAAGSFESKFLGQDIMADKEKTYTTYWETYADQIPTDLKVWIQAGDADEKVPYTQSVNFATRLAGYIGEENVEHSIIPGVGHEAEAFYTDENLDAVFAWLDGFMK